MKELMADGHIEDSFTQVPETWAVVESQRETQEMEGGSKGKDQDGVHNIEAKIDMDESMVNDGSDKTFPSLVPETWAVASENQQKTQETEGGNKGEFKSDVKDDIKTKVSKAIDQRQMDSFAHVLETWAVVVQSQRETQETEDGGGEVKVQAAANNDVGEWPTNTYGSLHTRSGDLGINRCKTQDKDNDDEEARVEADVWEEEVKQSIETKVDAYNKESEQSMTRDDDGQASHQDSKNVIKTSSKDASVKIFNSNMRLYHETGQSEKYRAWSRKDLKVGMHLKVLHGVVNVIIQIKAWGERHKTKMCDGSKCLEQGDDRDKGGTCIKPKELCSKGEQGAMTTGHGKAKNERMIWWIGWRQWFE